MEEIKQLFKIVKKLQEKYPHKKFTLDGRLVGDIGEVLVAEKYNITLFSKQEAKHDGYVGNKNVQIKSTFKKSLAFPHGKNKIPEYYLGIKIDEDGNIEEIYNGPGEYIWEIIKHRKRPSNGMHNISITRLKNIHVDKDKKIKEK